MIKFQTLISYCSVFYLYMNKSSCRSSCSVLTQQILKLMVLRPGCVWVSRSCWRLFTLTHIGKFKPKLPHRVEARRQCSGETFLFVTMAADSRGKATFNSSRWHDLCLSWPDQNWNCHRLAHTCKGRLWSWETSLRQGATPTLYPGCWQIKMSFREFLCRSH